MRIYRKPILFEIMLEILSLLKHNTHMDQRDFKVVVEIPSGGGVKYEMDEKTGELTVDRFLHTAFAYPFNYGFIQGTHGQDGDPVDVIILSSSRVMPGSVMKCHAIGLLEMEDEAGIDTKIIAVPDKKIDPWYGVHTSISDIPEMTKQKIKHFFDHYKELEPGKWIKTGEFKDSEDAYKEISASFDTK